MKQFYLNPVFIATLCFPYPCPLTLPLLPINFSYFLHKQEKHFRQDG